MASMTREEVKAFLDGMTVREMIGMVKELEEEWGVEAAVSPVIVDEREVVAPVQTEFDVVLTSFGDRKIKVIKALRVITGLGLKEAKALVEAAPVAVRVGVSAQEAEALRSAIEEEGGVVDVR